MTELALKVRQLADAMTTWAPSLSAVPPLKWTGRLWITPNLRSRLGAMGPKSQAAGFLESTLDKMKSQLDAIEGKVSLVSLDAERQRLELNLFDITTLAQQVNRLRSEIEVPKSILDMPVNQQLGQYHTHGATEITEGVISPEILGEGDPSGKVLRPGRWD